MITSWIYLANSPVPIFTPNPRSEYEWLSESCSVMSDSLRLHGVYSPWNFPDQNTGVGSLCLLQGIFPTQGFNPGLLHCRRILYQLSHKGSPRILEWVAYSFSRESSQPRNQTRVSCIAGGFFTNWDIREAFDLNIQLPKQWVSQVALVEENLPANVGDIRDVGSVPKLGRSHGYPLQYSCLENPMDRAVWWAMVHRVAKSWTQLNSLACTHAKQHVSFHT